MSIKCGDIMTSTPISHGPDASLNTIANTMAEMDLGPVLIVDTDSNKLLGIVTDRDIVVKGIARDLDPKSTPVKLVMTPNPVTCYAEDNINTAVELMEQCQIRRIPVIDTNQHLLGIISQADLATRLHDREQTGEVVEQISTDIVPNERGNQI